jgi:IclR family transcriptional regulator, KDG regulon repressor
MKSLNKVLDILEVFITSESSEIRLSELAKITGLHKATVNRMVSVLVQRGYLAQQESRGKYALGGKFLTFSAAIKQKMKISNIARPHLNSLNKKVKESASLFRYDGERVVFLEEVYSTYPLRIIPGPERSVPHYCTAIGKILLADKTENELVKYLAGIDIQSYTPNTITDLNKLKKHINKIKKEGIAYDFEEWHPGVMSVAAGILDDEERLIGCVAILGPSVRLTKKRLLEMAPFIRQCAMKISLDLGYRA